VEAVARQFVRCSVIADLSCVDCLGDELADQLAKTLLGACYMLVAMQKMAQIAVGVSARLVGDLGVGVENSRQALFGFAGLLGDLGEFAEVAAYLAFVPRPQDRLDMGEVLVKGRSPDPSFLRDLRHRYRQKSTLLYEDDGRVEDRVTDFAAMGFDGLGPQLGHAAKYTVRPKRDNATCIETDCLVKYSPLADRVEEPVMADRPQGQIAGPPPRPRWVRLLFVIALVAVVLVIIFALAEGEHGPSRHDPEGGNSGVHTPPVEHMQ